MSLPKKVLGKRVYITLPPKEESKIIVDENTKEELSRQMLKKMQKLKVWAVGIGADPNIEVGQMVLVDPEALQRAKMVPFHEDGEEIFRAVVMDYDIVHIW